MSKALGDTEKTVLVGALILGGWLAIDALVTRAERKSMSESNEQPPRSAASRRAVVARARRPRRRQEAV